VDDYDYIESCDKCHADFHVCYYVIYIIILLWGSSGVGRIEF